MQNTNESKTNTAGIDSRAVSRNYKDTVFRMLFREKENLLSLYNALNETSYMDINNLEITTLENAVYMNYKNDISFVFDSELMLYEHQSTVNPNMPLRDLIYVSKVWQGRIKEQNIYARAPVWIPAPKFVVFYNGTDFQPEKQTLKLSEIYETEQEEPELELAVTVYNINPGYNQALMDNCQLLKEYSQYVEQVRYHIKKMPLSEAVETAVNYCIRNGILSDFLLKNRAEAIEMCIFEFDEEKFLKNEREYAFQQGQNVGRELGRQEGCLEGKKEGIRQGEALLTKLIQLLIDTDKSAEIPRIISDREYRERLYQENRLV